ncbi:MAG: SRPBCC family protein [Myxococcota bacterium]|nr:SRPBCC family protein [Myxococcota bacterium]
MSVVTADLLLTNARRDEVFAWLGDPTNHPSFLQNVFSQVEEESPDSFRISLKAGFKKRTFLYRFDQKDDSHGGRRIRIKTTGKRAEGTISYSLRTMKPSRNTLLTVTWDYSAGGQLGYLLNQLNIQQTYMEHIKKILGEIDRVFPRPTS